MFRQIAIGCIITLLFSSCFEVIEDIAFKSDGSGNLRLIVNCSQSKSEINALLKLDSASGYKIPDESDLNAYMDQAVRTLKITEGIDKVVLTRDFTNWIFEVKLSFRNTSCLEAALKNLHSDLARDEAHVLVNLIKYNGKVMERDLLPADETVVRQLNRPTERKILSKAQYTSVYRFDKPVASCSNPRAKISPSRKAVMLQSNILNLINGGETLKNIIQIQP